MASVADLPITHTHGANELWAEIVDDVNAHGQVLVRNDELPDVVVMSVDKFEKLQQGAMDRALAKVDAEIERQVAVMNAPGAKDAWRALMDATPQEIADAINAANANQRKG